MGSFMTCLYRITEKSSVLSYALVYSIGSVDAYLKAPLFTISWLAAANYLMTVRVRYIHHLGFAFVLVTTSALSCLVGDMLIMFTKWKATVYEYDTL